MIVERRRPEASDQAERQALMRRGPLITLFSRGLAIAGNVLVDLLLSGGAMTNHVRMAIYSITQGTYAELMERAREGMAPILRDSPGFVFYSTTDVGGGRFVSVSTWETREQAEAATEKAAQWVSENLADSVSLEENLIGEMTTLAATERAAV